LTQLVSTVVYVWTVPVLEAVSAVEDHEVTDNPAQLGVGPSRPLRASASP
jgi:hypothetical protein